MTFRKIHFPTTFGGLFDFLRYLYFCVKHKNLFISEMERDRAISRKFLTCMILAESTGDSSSQKLFSCHFWRPS